MLKNKSAWKEKTKGQLTQKKNTERDLVNASDPDTDSDNSDDESEEEHGDAFHKLCDG